MILVEREPSNSTDLDAGNPTYKLREIIGNAIVDGEAKDIIR